jgi:hypothetical protein
MATLFKNAIDKDIGTTPKTLYTVSGSGRTTVIGLSLTNTTDFPVNVNVLVSDGVGNQAYYVKDILIPSNSSLRPVDKGEKLILDGNNTIAVSADTESSIDAILSYVEVV